MISQRIFALTRPGRIGAVGLALVILAMAPAAMALQLSPPAEVSTTIYPSQIDPAQTPPPVDPQTTPPTPPAQTPPPPVTEPTAQTPPVAADPQGEAATEAAAEAAQAGGVVLEGPAAKYHWWVLAPALVAIILAIVSRQVIPALVVGILVGGYMLLSFPASFDNQFADSPTWIRGIRVAAEHYIMNAVIDPGDGYGHLKIIIFTVVIGFTVGVIGRNGGTAGMVQIVAGKAASPRRGGVTAWMAGLVIFFDDYANTMIIGPMMRSVFDKVRLSRAKLAYIVDSTAAPVASLMFIGTWAGVQLSYIQEGLDQLDPASQALLESQNANMSVFWQSIPYRFYPLFALLLVFLVVVTRRDFGPMRKSEANALTNPPKDLALGLPGDEHEPAPPTWWLGALPILVLVGATVWVLFASGLGAVDTSTGEWAAKGWVERSSEILGGADAYVSIFYGALASAVVALVLTVLAGTCKSKDAVEAGVEGMMRMFGAVVILVLAWAISSVCKDLNLGQVVAYELITAQFPAELFPLAVFVAAAVISFATGTSYGTMALLVPVSITVGMNLIGAAGITDPAVAQPLFYASVGSVLAGAIFGDHCSPISDTTVLSSIASGCPHEEHVWTQIPYALLAAVVSMGMGNVLTSYYGQPWYIGLAAGSVFLILFVLLFGRQPKEVPVADPGEATEVANRLRTGT